MCPDHGWRVEHAADIDAGEGSAVPADANEATRELVHDDKHPIGPQHDGLAAQEVDAPQAVGGVSDERQPRGPRSARGRAIVFRQHAVHDGMPRAGLCRVQRESDAVRGAGLWLGFFEVSA